MNTFLNWLRDKLRQLLTGKDNKTLDPARVGAFVALIVLVVATFWKLALDLHGQSLREIAESFGIATGAGGVGAALTNSSQPQPDTTTAVADNKGNAVAETKSEG